MPVWDPVSGEKLFELPSHQNGIHAVDFHPEKAVLVTVDGSRQVRLWNLEDRSLIREWNAGSSSVGIVRFSQTGRHILTAAGPASPVPQPVPANQPSPPAANQQDNG
ncbi:MAG: WD40 repeat domain-containing protein, partial [Phycisphaerae bacterium]